MLKSNDETNFKLAKAILSTNNENKLLSLLDLIELQENLWWLMNSRIRINEINLILNESMLKLMK